MTVTPSVFTVNECGRIDDGRLEWATDTNVEHVINDMNGRRCTRPACSHSFSKRIEKSVSQRRVDVRVDPSAKHTNICVTHRRQLVPPTATGVTSIHASSTADKPRRTNARRGAAPASTTARVKSDDDSDNGEYNNGGGGEITERMRAKAVAKARLALGVLSMTALKRYKKYFRVPTRLGAGNKQHLVESIVDHFQTIEVDEKQVLTYFIYSVKTNKNHLDQQTKSAGDSR